MRVWIIFVKRDSRNYIVNIDDARKTETGEVDLRVYESTGIVNVLGRVRP